jgi:hypothetical protein
MNRVVLIAAVLAVLLAPAFAGCAGDDDDNSGPGSDDSDDDG